MRQTELRELAAIHPVQLAAFANFSDVFNSSWLMFSSVYLARSLRSDKFSCTAWPFNLVEFALIFVLSTQNDADAVAKSVLPIFEMVNYFYVTFCILHIHLII